MRYYSYNDFNSYQSFVTTKSEVQIRAEYGDYWYKKMCEKFEQSYVDENYTFEDCLEDWISIYNAWPTNEFGNKV